MGRDNVIQKRAADIMDQRFGVGWRNRPMLRSPEYIRAWQEAEAATSSTRTMNGDSDGEGNS